MLRVLDVRAALEQLPVAESARGELVLEVRDAMLPANAGAWHVEAREGRLRVRPAGAAGRDARARLDVGIDSLALVVSGAVNPARAVEAGWLASVNGAAELVEPWFRARSVFVMPMNAF